MSISDQLANDRTFLAWLRTSIALAGLGFVVSKISLILGPDGDRTSDASAYAAVGVLLIWAGAAVVIVGYRQHRAVRGSVISDDDEHGLPRRWTLTFTVVSVAVAIALSTLVILTT